jgi:hypothetical protein
MSGLMLRMVRWLIFGVVISLLPLGLTYFDLRMNAKPVAVVTVIGNGELFVIVWVLSAGAIGELFGSGNRFAALKAVCGGITLIAILAAGHAFASVTEARAAQMVLDDAYVVKQSINLFLFSLVPSMACVAMSEI